MMIAQNHRRGLEHIETSNSGANHAVSYAQNDRWVTHRDLHAGTKVAVLHAKTTSEGWDQ